METVSVLDHGYIELIETWGSDERIIESARMSTGKGFRGWGPNYKCRTCGCLWRDNRDNTVSLFDSEQHSCQECELKPTPEVCDVVPGDEKLLKFLYDNKHMTPFEMAGMTIEVQAPIFVFREWHRHRTQSYNEMSGRYIVLPDLYYIPSIERIMSSKQSATNKQSSEAGISKAEATAFRYQISGAYKQARHDYETMINAGVAREVARVILPVGQYSRMRASANLRNWLAFLSLRMDPAAQWEIRQYANIVGDIISKTYPRTWELFHLSH